MVMTATRGAHVLEDASHLLTYPEDLRECAQQQGYLYFRHLLSPLRVLEVRRRVLEICHRHHWLEPSAALMNGMTRQGFSCVVNPMDAVWSRCYNDILRLREVHALALEHHLMLTMEKVFGARVLVHPRNIVHAFFPGSYLFPAPIHQDHAAIGGSPNTWSAWIPLGDCPRELGGLALLPGSHTGGMLFDMAMSDVAMADKEEECGDWLDADMNCGDVLLMHNLLVYKEKGNQAARQLGLAATFRYQPLCDPVPHDAMQPYQTSLTWDQIYATWDAEDPVKYFWREWKISLAT